MKTRWLFQANCRAIATTGTTIHYGPQQAFLHPSKAEKSVPICIEIERFFVPNSHIMKNKIVEKRIHIGIRIRQLRGKLGMTQQTLAQATGLSEGTIMSIETGQSGYVIDSILAVCFFFGYEMEELLNTGFAIPDYSRLREKISRYHKRTGSASYEYLFRKPRAKTMLKESVLPAGFLNSPREIKAIKWYLLDRYNLEYLSSTLTNALRALAKEGIIKIMVTQKKGVFSYQSAGTKD